MVARKHAALQGPGAERPQTVEPQGFRWYKPDRLGATVMLRKILAVDDSALIHQMYKLFLSRYKNCKLISAMNGLEALDKLAQEEGIDLILLDINMPVMNGLEFLQRLQKESAYQAIPVIIISTEGKEEDTIRGLKMGAKGYVKKPFQASELHGLIEKITAAG
jgi:two-component system, chemotaxis family, chemotaxis protein CheY